MKHYKDAAGKVYAYASDQQMQQFAKVPLTAITDAEKDALLAPPPETQEELIARYDDAVEAYTNEVAQSKNYKNIDSISKYLVAGNYFEPEAKALSLWVGQVWVQSQTMLNQFIAGEITQPTIEEVIASLPTPPVKGTDYVL